MTDPADMTAAVLAAAFAARSLSPSEAWAAVERRVAAWEPRIAALYADDPEGARGSGVPWPRP